MFVGNRGFAGLGYLGVSPNIHTTGTDHTSDVYASPSGMVGKEINGKWCLFKPPVGVTYETDYAGTVITVQNLGDGTYYHSGYLAIRQAIAAGSTLSSPMTQAGAIMGTPAYRLMTIRNWRTVSTLTGMVGRSEADGSDGSTSC